MGLFCPLKWSRMLLEVGSAAFFDGISSNSAADEPVNYFDLCATTHE